MKAPRPRKIRFFAFFKFQPVFICIGHKPHKKIQKSIGKSTTDTTNITVLTVSENSVIATRLFTLCAIIDAQREPVETFIIPKKHTDKEYHNQACRIKMQSAKHKDDTIRFTARPYLFRYCISMPRHKISSKIGANTKKRQKLKYHLPTLAAAGRDVSAPVSNKNSVTAFIGVMKKIYKRL